MEKYTVEYFIDKFTKIPEKRWCLGFLALDEMGKIIFFGDSTIPDKCCALGHCSMRLQEERWIETEESKALTDLFQEYFGIGVWVVNDGIAYKENIFNFLPVPKQRILMALYTIEQKIAAENNTKQPEIEESLTPNIKKTKELVLT